MTVLPFPRRAVTRDPAPAKPGAATVGDLRTMPSSQALSIMFMRDWYSGCREPVADAFSESLGPGQGTIAMEAFDALLDLLSRDGRRPLCCHALHCMCVGADEAVLANLLHLAATGEREEAMLIASLLLPADRVMLAVEFGRVAGLGIMRVSIRDQARSGVGRMPIMSRPDTLH